MKFIEVENKFKDQVFVQCNNGCAIFQVADTGDNLGCRWWFNIFINYIKKRKDLEKFLNISGVDDYGLEMFLRALDYAYDQGVSICTGFGEFTFAIKRDSILPTEATKYTFYLYKLKDLNKHNAKEICKLEMTLDAFNAFRNQLKEWYGNKY